MNMTAINLTASSQFASDYNNNEPITSAEQQPASPPAPYQTVVFSRKTTYNGPNNVEDEQVAPSPLARLVHQTDRNGKPSPHGAVPSPSQSSSYLVSAPSNAQARKLEAQNRAMASSMQSANSSTSNIQVATVSGQTKGLSKFLSNVYSVFGLNNENAGAGAEGVVRKQRGIIPPYPINERQRKCLVLDLDETLVHSSFKPTPNPDYIIPVEIDGHVHRVYVGKRPGVDEFMRQMGQLYEIVVYTASLSKYADPLLDQLDVHKVIRHRLFREHCVHYEGTYVKDLSLIDRDLTQTVIIDNSPLSYMFHPQNAIGCSSFIDDPSDRELPSIMNFLTDIHKVSDVREHLHAWTPNGIIPSNITRSNVHQ